MNLLIVLLLGSPASTAAVAQLCSGIAGTSFGARTRLHRGTETACPQPGMLSNIIYSIGNKLILFISQVMEVLYNVPPKESEAEEVGEGIQST